MKKNITLLLCIMIMLLCSVFVMGAYYDDPATYASYDEFNDASINVSHLAFYDVSVEIPPSAFVAEGSGLITMTSGGAGFFGMSLSDSDAGVGASGNVKGVNFSFAIKQNADSDGNEVAIVVSNSRLYQANKANNSNGTSLFTMSNAANNGVWFNFSGEWAGDTLNMYQNGVLQSAFTFLSGATYYLRFDHQPDGGAPSAYNVDWIRTEVVAPTITNWSVNQPLNDTIHNSNTNFYFNVTDADLDDVDCSLKNNDTFTASYYNVTYQEQPFMTYTIGANEISTSIFHLECNDSYGNWVNSTEKTIFFDNINPVINWNNPKGDNTTFITTATSGFDINITDDNLYRTNISCWLKDGDMLFNNYTDAITTGSYEFLDIQTLSSDGIYYCEVSATDSHTKTDIPTLTTSKTTNSIKFDDIIITLLDKPQLTDYTKMKDKYAFQFTTSNIDTKIKTYNIKVSSSNKIDYLSNSKYIGHFVIGDKWLDFEGYKDVVVKKELDYYIVSITTTDNILKFNSIGLLNNITEYRQFEVDNTAPVISLTTPIDTYIENVTYSLSFIYNYSDYRIGTCYLLIDNVTNGTYQTPIQGLNTLSRTMTNGTYTWMVECNDGNLWTNSSIYDLTINLSEEMKWLNCNYEKNPNLEIIADKIVITCYNSNNLNGKYRLNVMADNNLISSYPQHEYAEEFGYIDTFNAENGLVTMYYKQKDLQTGREFILNVISNNGDINLSIVPAYSDLKFVPEKLIWSKNNMAYIIGSLIIAGFLVVLWRKR